MPAVIRSCLLMVFLLCQLPLTAEGVTAPAVEESRAEAAALAPETGVLAAINDSFQQLNGFLEGFLFVKIGGIPLIVAILVLGGIFFTFAHGFVNLRLFGHAIACVRGRFDNAQDAGEISHFRALTAALSATVGLGNIAGVSIAIYAGGPGAIFWMWVIAFFGMTLKFNSCTLALLYRRIRADGSVLGGPMVYLRDGLARRGMGGFGGFLGGLFAICCLLAAFGGGNMFQVGTTAAILQNVLPGTQGVWFPPLVGAVLAILVGIVIIGGIRRIGEVTAKLVPLMCVLYCLVCLILIAANYGKVPGIFADIFRQAFQPNAAFAGGFIGILVLGAQRAAFSNEAGLGSAAIAHAAAKTDEPVREGLVAMLEPFIDTIVVCTMTALAILVADTYVAGAQITGDLAGTVQTANAFATLHPFFGYFLGIAALIFAYSTLISWSYYGERCILFLCGDKALQPYRILYVVFAAVAPIVSIGNIIDASMLVMLLLAVPNILGSLLLLPDTRRALRDYLARLRSGAIQPKA